MQSRLEQKGIEKRSDLMVRNDYLRNDEYSDTHKDALSDGDPLGKGAGEGGADHTRPGRNFVTDPERIGGQYDIEGYNGIGGRRFLMNIDVYNHGYEYGPNLIDTEANVNDGQIVVKP